MIVRLYYVSKYDILKSVSQIKSEVLSHLYIYLYNFKLILNVLIYFLYYLHIILATLKC